jgi:hypothetical protein
MSTNTVIKRQSACARRDGRIFFPSSGSGDLIPFAIGEGRKLKRIIRQLAELGVSGGYFVPGIREAGEDDKAAVAALAAFSTRVKEALREDAP